MQQPLYQLVLRLVAVEEAVSVVCKVTFMLSHRSAWTFACYKHRQLKRSCIRKVLFQKCRQSTIIIVLFSLLPSASTYVQ